MNDSILLFSDASSAQLTLCPASVGSCPHIFTGRTSVSHQRPRCGCSTWPVSGLWVYLIKTMSSCLSWEMRERGRYRILNSHPACVCVTTFGSWRSWRMETARPEGVTCPRVWLPEGCAEEGVRELPAPGAGAGRAGNRTEYASNEGWAFVSSLSRQFKHKTCVLEPDRGGGYTPWQMGSLPPNCTL